MKTRIEGIGTYRLILDIGYYIYLKSCLYVPGCARILVSVAKLDGLNFNFRIGNSVFSIFKNSYYYGSSILVDGLYRLFVMLILKNLCLILNMLLVISKVKIMRVLLICGINYLVTYPKKE